MIRSTDPTADALRSTQRWIPTRRAVRDDAPTGRAPLDPIALYPSLYAERPAPQTDELRRALHAFGAAMAALVRKPAV